MIHEALSLLCSGVHELRALDVPCGSRRTRVEFGYFNDLAKMATAAEKLSKRGARAVYFTPNPVLPELLSRAANRILGAKRGLLTQDNEIQQRRWLLVDLDAIRPAGISATDKEKKQALQLAELIAEDMVRLGWPEPVSCDSGNGAHLMWRISEPNDLATTSLLQRILIVLHEKWSNEAVKVDRTVYNAARIWKIPGTLTRKGDASTERPHRLSALLTSGNGSTVSRDLLERFAPPTGGRQVDGFDLVGFVSTHFPAADGPHEYKGGQKWVLPVCPFNSEHDDKSACIIERPDGYGFICHHDGCRGRDWKQLRALFEKRLEVTDSDVAQLVGEKKKRPWKSALIYNRDKKGKPTTLKPISANVLTILGNDKRWLDVLGYDLFACRAMALVSPPWHEHDSSETARPPDNSWTDIDDVRTQSWLSRHWGLHFRGKIGPLVEVVAQRNPVHPIREYLKSLAWDGRPRIPVWPVIYLGAVDSPYVRSVGRWWLISAVARVFQPGCKADHVLILEGPQGAGKSTALRILANGWFNDTPVDLGTKDSFMAIRGRWIVELAELDSLGRAAAARAKSFFSSPVDSFRPPYGARTIDQPRQCVFAGSTNENTYLRDPTGGRRFWPIQCGELALDGLRRDRDMIWAEALKRYQDGELWYPSTAEEHRWCSSEQDNRYQGDPWEEIIIEWLSSRPYDECTTRDVLVSGLGIEKGRITRAQEMRVAAILRRLGCKRKRTRLHGKPTWAYSIPEFKKDGDMPF